MLTAGARESGTQAPFAKMATEKHIQLLLKGEARGLELAKEGGLNTQALWGEKHLPPAMCSPNPSQGPSYMMTKPKQTFDYNKKRCATAQQQAALSRRSRPQPR